MTAPILADLDAALAGAKARYDHADAPDDYDVRALIRAAEAARAALTLTPTDTDNVTLFDAVIDDVADGWMQGDSMPTAEAFVRAIKARGYELVRVPVDGDTLYGVPDWNDPERLLLRYTSWLHRQEQLVPDPADTPDDLADRLEDMALHFLADERETAQIPDDAPAGEQAPTVDRSPVPAHLDPEFDSSGHAMMPALVAADGLGEVAAYESATSEASVWVAVADTTAAPTRVRVPVVTAWKFAEQLITLVRNHQHGDATPAGAAYAVTPLFGTVDGGR